MRYFVALEIPNESKSELEGLQDKIKQILPEIRLTDPEKLHLTIAFIGEQDDNLKPELIEIITQATADINTFTITPAFIDGFPNPHYPHTIWVGVKGEIDKLMVIRERIKDNLARLKIDIDERRFIPHIAIGKLTNNLITENQESALQKLMLQENFNPIPVTSIKLFASIPDHGFHAHNTLAEIKLVYRE